VAFARTGNAFQAAVERAFCIQINGF